MKKKLFLTLMILMLCITAFTVAVSAKDIDTQISDVNGNPIILPTVDGEGDALTWYRVTAKPADGVYYEYVGGNTTYYIVGAKTKSVAYVNDKYKLCYSHPDILTSTYNNGNLVVANLKGITHTDGKGPEYLNFTFEYTGICYAYIPASIVDIRGHRGNGLYNLFQGCGSLSEIEFEPGSKIETLYGTGFYNCGKLKYLVLPENLKTIPAGALISINGTIVVPKSVTTFEATNGVNPTVLFTGTASDHAGWTYQPSKISYVEHCDVYYNGQHLAYNDDFDCTTSLLCANCGKELSKAQDSHNIKTVCEYPNGFLDTGVYESKCQTAGCNYVEQSKELEALFTCIGYSTPNDGSGGIAIGFTVNNVAIAEYEEVKSVTLNYGVFVVLQSKLKDNDVFSGGTAAEGVISAEITSYQFTTFELKIIGFADDQKSAPLAMGAYVATTNGETTSYSYIQDSSKGIFNGKYYFASYNDIVGKSSESEEVLQ